MITAERTCDGCEWQHNRHHCEAKYIEKHGHPCKSDKSISVVINNAINRNGKTEIT